jgi:hypothetical protein
MELFLAPTAEMLAPPSGQGDLRLTLEGGGHMVLRKDKTEFENFGLKSTAL